MNPGIVSVSVPNDRGKYDDGGGGGGGGGTNSTGAPEAGSTSKPKPRPAHHLNDSGTLFTNPWPSFRAAGHKELFNAITTFTRPPVPPQITQLMRSRSPDWGITARSDRLKATWLGHACFLVELPTPPGAARGPRILFDPVFSHRCSPFSWLGPARFTAPPCALSQLPEVDIIVLSHNHYDHMDKPTLRDLVFPPSTPTSATPRIHVFAPLNNNALFASLSIPPSHVHCLDWWDERVVSVEVPAARTGTSIPPTDASPNPGAVPDTKAQAEHAPYLVNAYLRLTCTPSQHFSGRGILDRHTTLWSSWVVEAPGTTVPRPNIVSNADTNPYADAATAASLTSEPESPKSSSSTPSPGPRSVKLWFGGDTGYRTVRTGEDEDTVPVCPVFRDIGARWGGFDLALIPIGAYLPRAALSPVHCAPQDSVCVFKDIRARKALAMHWGTWCLSYEQIMEPAEQLQEACKKAGLPEDAFGTCGIGETVAV